MNGVRLAHTDPRAHNEGEQQHRHRRHKEKPDESAPHRRQRPCAGHSQYKADGRAAGFNRHTDNKVCIRIDAAECGAHRVWFAAHRSLGDILRHGEYAIGERGVSRQQQVPVCVADEKLRVRYAGGKISQFAQSCERAAFHVR